ncbi:MAG: hypothetical protein WAT19_06465 [Ferruginibacter sp.]
MLQENSSEHMPHKSPFLRSLFRWRFAVAIAMAAAILFLFSCKKIVEDTQQDIAQQYFENNILNSDFVIDSAYDNDVDITARYAGFRMRLLKTTLTDGPITATKTDSIVNGTWLAAESYGKLSINFTNPPAGFPFFNRSWRFLEKNLPVMKLAPWGVAGSSTRLYLRRL